ncbi:MAG: CoA transferase [Aeromicrobium sp.]
MSRTDRADEIARWARSGAMALTGRHGGPPVMCVGRPASVIREELAALAAVAGSSVDPRGLPDVRVLGERAAIAGLHRQGPLSCGGAFRAVPTLDGWIGLSLARGTDLDLVPALVSSDSVVDAWSAVTAWAAHVTTQDADARIELLGLPGAAVPVGRSPAAGRPPVVITEGGRRDRVPDRPLVVDFTALWAGPLCAHLLGLTGADVVKVESTTRPDGARSGPSDFFDLLHAGHRSITVDPSDPADRDALLRLVTTADLVLEASRPRALRGWGLEAPEIVAAGTSWLSITARGRASDRVGFGDDVAVGAGLLVVDRDEIMPCGDAVADPLTGVVAARHAAEALAAPRARLVDVSMHDVCRVAAAGPPVTQPATRHDAGVWSVDTGREWVDVAAPHGRRPTGGAAASGEHRSQVLGR